MNSHIRDSSATASIISVTGELDVYTSPLLKRDLRALVARRREYIIINMENVSYIDSTAIGVLVDALRTMKLFGASLTVVTKADHLKRIFQLLGLTKIVPIFENEAAAILASTREAAHRFLPSVQIA